MADAIDDRAHAQWKPDIVTVAVGVGVAVAVWLHAEAFGRPAAEIYRDLRWPYIAGGVSAMVLALPRPLRWGGVAVAVAMPTALTGCYFIGTQLAAGAIMPWHHVRIAATMFAATLIGAALGRVAGGIQRGL